MGLLSSLSPARWFGNRRLDAPQSPARQPRACRFEEFETRRPLAADPLLVGSVYFEQAAGDDAEPNILQFSFEGGAPGTQLTRIIIDGDKDGRGISAGDVFFDTAPGGLGVFGSNPLEIISHDGFEVVGTQVVDGGMRMVIDLRGFEAGELLVLSVDVDEFQFVDPTTGEIDVNAVAEGAEFQRSKFITSFVAPHYEDLTTSVLFWDAYTGNFAAAQSATGKRLDLPPDRYTGAVDQSDLTAGAVAVAEQVPLPNSISGVVFLDHNLNNRQDAGDPGLGGVTLALLQFDGNSYVATGLTTVTDTEGNYQFDDLEIGRFRVVEAQPAGYLSVGATPGTVNGQTRGVVTNANVLSGIELRGGEDSVRNDFAEYQPVSISGFVHANTTGDCENPENPPIPGVRIELLDSTGRVIATTTTDEQGFYIFEDMRPGTYGVRETQPAGFFDGADRVGSAGGRLANDLITEIVLTSGTDAVNYNFCELVPVSISGFVRATDTGDCTTDPNPEPISGVTIELLDSSGSVIATTLTNDQGFYSFAELAPGTYGVREIQPEGYLDGLEHVGSAGGQVFDDLITEIVLTSGTDGVGYNFCEVRPVSISGFVHATDTGDCTTDPNPEPIAGVTIELLDSTGSVIAVTQTNDQGFYSFVDLAPGTYGVREIQPEGFLDGLEQVGSAGGRVANDLITEIVLSDGIDSVGYNFCEVRPAGISGFVYSDLNDNGRMDPGERGIEGVTVYLKDAEGNPTGATTLTDANGYYEFVGLRPGTYGVGEVQPEGWLDGTDSPGSAGGTAVNPGDMIMGAILKGGEIAVDYNFGELLPVSIAGFVHSSETGDCTTDPNAEPIAGVTIELLDETGIVIATTQTNDQGFYHFVDLAPGTYGVREIQPEGFLDGQDHVGSAGGRLANDLITEIVLTSGVEGVNYNFCEIPPAPPDPEPPIVILPPPPGTPDPPPPPGAFFAPAEIPPIALPETPFLVQRILTRSGGQLYTWHLSVINSGFPRGALPGEAVMQVVSAGAEHQVAWKDAAMDDVKWTILDWDGEKPEKRELHFGMRGALPIAGDFNGDGKFEVGVFKDGFWFIDLNDNGEWDEGDLWAKLGHDGDLPVTGDWDGDGKSDIGIYGPAWSGDPRAIAHEPGLPEAFNDHQGDHKNIPPEPEKTAVGRRTLRRTSQGKPRSDLIDHVFHYGTPGDRPVVGDWNGDGIHTIGIFRYGTWRRDADGNGRKTDSDHTHTFGRTGDIPLVGDFNGDGIEELVIYRDGVWYIDTNGNGTIDAEDQVIRLGSAGDTPIVGDFDGDGRAEIAVFHDSTARTARR